jgi:hypothetical protein
VLAGVKVVVDFATDRFHLLRLRRPEQGARGASAVRRTLASPDDPM